MCVGLCGVQAMYGATGFTINVRKNSQAQHDHIKTRPNTEGLNCSPEATTLLSL